ncbi:hypothetical protein MBAV_005329 [Candidatus Magnetobacterium bavaricum]|uniref:Sucrose phosphatase-like domain-containing protein n=1 Tax=Candidatus Magnetobacterium bavaricum TaxID=29290 RepID=A0A0F3GKQ7_9BACT|nr:hypothetical protein MBAV_005329 [Candidatus Magnetobacterium bavaricum]
MVFLDLDDTIFQTLRKDPQGTYPATGTSFMTEAQRCFVDLLLSADDVMVVPVTARDATQYGRTFLSEHPRIAVSALYYCGLITTRGLRDSQWHDHMQSLYRSLTPSIQDTYERVARVIDGSCFKLYNVDGYYVTLKHTDTSDGNYMATLQGLVGQLACVVEGGGYNIHHNDNNVSLVPTFLDKKHAIDYLVQHYQPRLTIGVGDSLSDLGFMTRCDYGIFPGRSQIGRLLEGLVS